MRTRLGRSGRTSPLMSTTNSSGDCIERYPRMRNSPTSVGKSASVTRSTVGNSGGLQPTCPASFKSESITRYSGSSTRFSFHYVARDNQALYLCRPLVYLKHFGIAIELLDHVILHVAVTAEDLHGLGNYCYCRVR